MAGCMIFVFAALGEFVVVKVLDVQYQYQTNRVPKMLPMVNVLFAHSFFCFIFKYAEKCEFTCLQRISAMEKGQCPTVATWESGNVRSRKATTTTASTPGQVKITHYSYEFIHCCAIC